MLKTISTKATIEMSDSLEALAHRLDTSPAELVRRFIEAGVAANDVTDAERSAARSRRSKKAKGDLPGLVVPLSPLASLAAYTAAAGASGKSTEIRLADDTSSEEEKWRGGGDSNPRYGDHPVALAVAPSALRSEKNFAKARRALARAA